MEGFPHLSTPVGQEVTFSLLYLWDFWKFLAILKRLNLLVPLLFVLYLFLI